MMFRLLFTFQLIVALNCYQLVAQESEFTAEDVIDNYIDAVGSEMTLLGIESATIEGTIKGSFGTGGGGEGMPISGTMKVQLKSRMIVIESKIDAGAGNSPASIQGFDGENWWRNIEGVRSELDEDSIAAMQGFVFGANQSLHWRDSGFEIKKLEDEEFDGKDAWHLVFTLGDNSIDHYFDKESGLIIGTRSMRNDMEMTTTYEHREIDGITCINRISMNSSEDSGLEMEYIMEFESFDFETEIPDMRFQGEFDSEPEDDN